MKALEHYEDLADIKRVIVHTNVFQPDVCDFSTLTSISSETFVVSVARQLFQPSDYGAINGLHARDAACQYSPKPASRHPDRNQVF